MPTTGDVPLGRGDLRSAPAQVEGACLREFGVRPRDRAGQGEVDLRDAVAVPEVGETAEVGVGEPGTRDLGERLRRRVEQHRTCGRELVDGAHLGAGDDLAAVGEEVCGERVDDRLAAADGDRPAAGVGVGAERQGCRRRREARHGPDRVRGHPAQHRRGDVLTEPEVPGGAPLLERPQAELGDRDRMPGHLQQLAAGELRHAVGVRGERAHERAPRRSVAAERVGGAVDVAVGDAGAAVVEGVRVGDLRHHQLDPAFEAEGAEEPRGERHRVDRRADVMVEAREGEFRGPRPAADGVAPLHHLHVQASSRKGHRGGEPVRAGADDHRVELLRRSAHAHPHGGQRRFAAPVTRATPAATAPTAVAYTAGRCRIAQVCGLQVRALSLNTPRAPWSPGAGA